MYGDGWLKLQKSDQRSQGSDPKQEHPADQFGLEMCQVGTQLSNTLLELGLEPSPIQIIDLTQLGPVRRIHLIEPLHELVGEVVPKPLVELARQPGSHRNRELLEDPVT